MSDQHSAWETDIRHQVEQHEFDYDPAAWLAMEQLLDAGVPPAKAAPTTSATTTWLRWALLIVAGAALAVYLWQTTTQEEAVPEVPQQEERILPEEFQEMESSTSIPPDEKEVERIEYATPSSRSIETLDPLPTRFRELQRLPSRTDAYSTSPLPSGSLEFLPDSLTARNALPEVKLPRRKRDRKKLFPDVLKQN